MKVLVTGAAGYVGSHTVLELLEAGYDVISLDNFANAAKDSTGLAPSIQRVAEITGKDTKFRQCDLCDLNQLDAIFKTEKFDAVMHLAALRYIGESVKKPYEYYSNNLRGSLNLIKLCLKYNIKNFVFSSSATVYGPPQELPITENCPTGVGVTNPYGQSKYMIETILKDLGKAEKDFNIIILRYFNPVGAHPSGRLGEDPRGLPSNLMPFICQVAAGKLLHLTINGNDYDTKDGTGVRDFIHVVDLARGHVKSLKRIEKEGYIGTEVYNLGIGQGTSVLEMVSAFERATGKSVSVKIGERRPEDVPAVYCDPAAARQKLDWKCDYGLEEMCWDHWNWQSKNPNGKVKSSKPGYSGYHQFHIEIFTVTREIAVGSEATVKEAHCKSFGVVAIKIYTHHDEKTKREIESLTTLPSHRNVIKLLGPIVGNRSQLIGLVLERMEKSLHNVIHDPVIEYSHANVYSWIRQVAEGVLHLHCHGILHRDIKPKNILLTDNDRHVKLADFGFSRKIELAKSREVGTYDYMAPEVIDIRSILNNEEKQKATEVDVTFGPEIDAYSLSITVWEMFYRKRPYDYKLCPVKTYCAVAHDGLRPAWDDRLHSEIAYLLWKGWHPNPEYRAGIKDFIEVVNRVSQQNVEKSLMDQIVRGAKKISLWSVGNRWRQPKVQPTESRIPAAITFSKPKLGRTVLVVGSQLQTLRGFTEGAVRAYVKKRRLRTLCPKEIWEDGHEPIFFELFSLYSLKQDCNLVKEAVIRRLHQLRTVHTICFLVDLDSGRDPPMEAFSFCSSFISVQYQSKSRRSVSGVAPSLLFRKDELYDKLKNSWNGSGLPYAMERILRQVRSSSLIAYTD